MSEVTSPKLGSDQFDALIELLATDDAADDSNFHIVPEGTASTGLRDPSGKLDYTKIRSLFQQRQAGKNTEHVSSSNSSPDPTINGPHPEMRLPEIVVEEPTALADNSAPVKPHPPPWVDESSEIKMVTEEGSIPNARVVLAPQASEDSMVLNLEDALSKAYEEIADLRRRVLELETQATELFRSNSPPQEEPNSDDIRGYIPRPITSTLSNTFGSDLIVPPIVDRSETERAIRFLIRADELVWRRSRYPNGPAPVYSQDNIDAVTQRLALWESIIRAPGPR